MSKAIIHFLNSSRGQYIPRDFAQTMRRVYIHGVSSEILDRLAKEDAAESESYWDDWRIVLDNVKIVHNGIRYTLHHDGDLWLINFDAMTSEEKQNFGFED